MNLAFSPDSRHIAVSDKSDVVSLLDLRAGKVLNVYKSTWEVNELVYSLTGDYLFVATLEGLMQVLSMPTMVRVHSVQGHTANMYSIKIDPRGRYLASGAADGIVSLYDYNELICIRAFTNIEGPVRAISFTHDGEYLSAGSEDNAIEIFHVETALPVAHITVPVPAFACNTMSWHPQRYVLAYAGDPLDGGPRYQSGVVRLVVAGEK